MCNGKASSSGAGYSSLPWGKTKAMLCKSTLQAPAGTSVPEHFSSHSGEGVSASFVSHPELLRARGQGFPLPQSVQRDMLNICKGHEIRCNREREGWLSVDLLEGCTVALPQGGRKRLLGTSCALGHACCVLASKQSQLAFFSSPSAVKLGVKSREKKACWLRSEQIELSELSCQYRGK